MEGLAEGEGWGDWRAGGRHGGLRWLEVQRGGLKGLARSLAQLSGRAAPCGTRRQLARADGLLRPVVQGEGVLSEKQISSFVLPPGPVRVRPASKTYDEATSQPKRWPQWARLL